MRKYAFLLFIIPAYVCALNSSINDLALQKQIVLFNDIDTTADNVANAETSGHKSRKIVQISETKKPSDTIFSIDRYSHQDFSDGGLKHTGNPYDLAVIGPNFFRIQTAQGVRYTKNGHFVTDVEGNLVTLNGDLVTDIGGAAINIPAGQDFQISKNGNIESNNEVIGQIGLVTFNNLQILKATGSSNFDANGQAEIVLEGGQVNIFQGYLENSNVNRVKEMTSLVQTQRKYDLASSILKTYDDLSRNSINKLSKQF